MLAPPTQRRDNMAASTPSPPLATWVSAIHSWEAEGRGAFSLRPRLRSRGAGGRLQVSGLRIEVLRPFIVLKPSNPETLKPCLNPHELATSTDHPPRCPEVLGRWRPVVSLRRSEARRAGK